MSDPKNISPLLDGFTLGAPIGEHHGVECFPAIKENTNKKYIVKTISVPATQTQFDAMMLAGVYKDPGDAMEYFREKGENILNEAELLKKLSKIEGFLSYDGWQMEPITRRRLGYEVYLVGSYKRSLEKYIRKHAFTHLEAVNFALDLCAALSVCRQSGFLYVDLKPSNIFVSEKKEFRIGDLGFLSLDALRYASLPERYFSPYTPPELLDPMASMNLTVDTYAVGMILYQLYNDGQLPFSGTAPLETLPVPCHADYEMADIIMKAIHPDPEQRWTDPKELGKAIAAYMQRNTINDIPITPFIPLDVNPEDIVPVSPKQQPAEDAESVTEESPVDLAELADPAMTSDSEEMETMVNSEQDSEPSEEPVPESDAEETLPAEIAEETYDSEIMDQADASEVAEETSDTPQNGEEEAKPETNLDEVSVEDVSEEVAKIISKADDIIAHEIPQDTLFPQEKQEDPFAFVKEDMDDLDAEVPSEPLMEENEVSSTPVKKKKTKHFADTSRKKKVKKFVSKLFTLLLTAGVLVVGFWYYRTYYLQTIDSLTISGTQTEITVLVDTSVEESALTVYCKDANGKGKTGSVQGGKAVFTDLKPSTQYTIELKTSGFHKLVGMTSDVFTTDATTQILSFEALPGTEHGSVILNFTVDGEEPNFWNIRYHADGEEEYVETVTEHSAMITGLTVGKVYTFTLDGGKNFDVGGMTSTQYLASRLVLAENIALSSNGTDITVTWDTPGDVVVESWNVRFYDGYGFEEQVTVTENEVLFRDTDPGSSYTVEITAAGMTQPASIAISADPIQVSNFHIDESASTKLKVSWEYSGDEPEGGWILLYSVDGSGTQIVQCEKASAEISPLLPGANYRFELQSADGRTIFNNIIHNQVKRAEAFTEHKFIAENVSFGLLNTPEDSQWHYETINEDSFTKDFQVGDHASVVMRSSTSVFVPGNKTTALFVFRDAYGNVLPDLVREESFSWKDIWMAGETDTAEMDLPLLPSLPGTYVLELYFNGYFVTDFDITITG